MSPRRRKLDLTTSLPAPTAPSLVLPQTPLPHLATGLPELDASLGTHGLPRGRVTEISGATWLARSLPALSLIRTLHAGSSDAVAVWIDLQGDLDHGLLLSFGIDESRLMIVRPRDGDDALNQAARILQKRWFQALVISGMPISRPQDQLYVGLLERLAIFAPWTRACILYLIEADAHSPVLARLAAVRLAVPSLVSRRSGRHSHYTGTVRVLKNRFGRSGQHVAVQCTIICPPEP